jgi:hypothetical protein
MSELISIFCHNFAKQKVIRKLVGEGKRWWLCVYVCMCFSEKRECINIAEEESTPECTKNDDHGFRANRVKCARSQKIDTTVA